MRARHLSLTRSSRPPSTTPFPYTTLFRSERPPSQYDEIWRIAGPDRPRWVNSTFSRKRPAPHDTSASVDTPERSPRDRSEEHTSELQSRFDLVCRLLLEKKKTIRVVISST